MLFLGIDWSDGFLDYHLRDGEAAVLPAGQVRNNLEGLTELFDRLEGHAAPERIGIAIETAHGAWVQALLDRGYRVYPVNPKSVDNFRKALTVAGSKSDKIDARTLAMFLQSCHAHLRPLRPDDPEIVTLRVLCEDRLRLVEEQTDKLNELGAILKGHYPAFPGLFGNLDSQIAWDFLEKYPTQQQMQKLTPKRLENWLKRQGYPWMRRLDEMVVHLQTPCLAVPIHLQMAKAPRIGYLVQSLRMLHGEIARCDEELNNHLDGLPEADWVRSLPGAGVVLAPALLACLGRDPNRFASVTQARALMGTAPVTKASGRTKQVLFRRGCWKFARRTLQLFANESRRQCPWAQAFYQKQRASGHKHPAAVRALAHKWVKILLAMKRTGTLYNEHVFVNSQKRYLLNSPIVNA